MLIQFWSILADFCLFLPILAEETPELFDKLRLENLHLNQRT